MAIARRVGVGRAVAWAVVAGALLTVGAPARSAEATPALSLSESMAWVVADRHFPEAAFPGAPPQPADAPWPAWPVVRLDVTNHHAVRGVYQLIIGARPGVYDWSGALPSAQQQGLHWAPLGAAAGAYLPQTDNGDGRIDWTTEVLPLRRTAAGLLVVELSDPLAGVMRPFALPVEFDGYEHVYRFETTQPYSSCTVACWRDSMPLGVGSTFAFYVTGGLASPLVYLDQSDYLPDGTLRGTFNGGQVPVPEPAVAWLLLAGLGLLAMGARRSAAG